MQMRVGCIEEHVDAKCGNTTKQQAYYYAEKIYRTLINDISFINEQ